MRSSRLGTRLGVEVHSNALDLADADAVQHAADATAAALGRIDILVASAGITGSQHDDLGISGRRTGSA